MEVIIYNNAPQQQALSNRLTNNVKNHPDIPQDIKDGLTDYTYSITHPIDGRVALIIERSGYYWQYIESEFTPAEINNIETLTPDWLPEPEIL